MCMDVPVELLLSQYPNMISISLGIPFLGKKLGETRISSFIFLIQKIYSIAVQSLLSMCISELIAYS